jgi:polyisoprenyl-teichoic acid--peptidoglycan teichoic acid transferase
VNDPDRQEDAGGTLASRLRSIVAALDAAAADSGPPRTEHALVPDGGHRTDDPPASDVPLGSGEGPVAAPAPADDPVPSHVAGAPDPGGAGTIPSPASPPVVSAGAPEPAGGASPAPSPASPPGVAAGAPEPATPTPPADADAADADAVAGSPPSPDGPVSDAASPTAEVVPPAEAPVQPALFDAAPATPVVVAEPLVEPPPPAAPPQPALFEPSPPGPPAPAAVPNVERARRRRKRRRYRRVRAVAFLLTLVVLVAAIPVLAYLGIRTISDSNQGRVIEPETDASAPGFEAVVDPTPTLLLAHEDADGELAGLTVLALGLDDQGGDVLFIPVGTMVEIPSLGLDRLGVAFDRGGIELVRQSAENLLGISFTDAVRVDPDRWEELVEPVAPLRVVNPDPIEVVDEDGGVEVAFPGGTVDVAADEVSDLLSLGSVGETQLARLVRHQAFWEAWLTAVGSAPTDDAVPGEVETGLGRFVRGLADGDVVYETLQVEPVSGSEPGGDEVYQADRDAVAAQISEIMPFAAAPEGGDRASVRILNGTGEPGLAQAVTSVLVPAGAEITVVGNADNFDYEETQVVFYDQAEEAVAERLRDALGAGEVVFSRVPNDAVDVTVVVGSDFEPPAADGGADEAGSESTG